MKKRWYMILAIMAILLLTSSLIGCKAEQVVGPQGPAGFQGEQGVQGEPGQQGLKGDMGPQGLIGPEGKKGDKGDKGDSGGQGIQGLQGIAGSTGPQGSPGSSGIPGSTGPQGVQGIQGIQGLQGIPGSQTPSSYLNMVQNGGLRLLEMQNTDGGWTWGDMTGVASGSASASPKNTVGVTALGLLKAYDVTGYDGFLDAAELSAAYITTNFGAGERMRGPDMTLLVELSAITGNLAYLATAQAGWTAILATPVWSGTGTATEFGNYIVTVRGGGQLAAWDINLYVVALSNLGYTADAIELATVTNTLLAGVLNPASDYYALALAGAIETYSSTGQFTGEILPLVASLLALQTSNGAISSPDSDVQATAYAIMALVSSGGNSTVLDMADYLYSAQTPTGGWLDAGGEYTEADSEAVCSLYLLLP